MAKKKSKSKKAKLPKEPLIVASKVKNFVKANGMMSSKEFLGEANKVFCETVLKAVDRAKQNKRSTIQPRDL